MLIRLMMPRGLFARTITTIASIIVIVLIMMSVLLYNNFESRAMDIAIDSNIKGLSQISYSADFMNENVRNFAFYLFNSNSIKPIMYQTELDPELWGEESYRIYNYALMHPFVHSVYVYNGDTKKAYVVNLTENSLESKLVPALVNKDTNLQPMKPVPMRMERNVGGKLIREGVYSYAAYDIVDDDHTIQGAVVVNVKSSYLSELISSLSNKTNTNTGSTLLINQQGTVVGGSDSELFNEDLSKESYVRKVLGSSTAEGHFLAELDGSRKLVTYVSSDLTGWKFIHTMDYELVVGQVERMKQLTILVCVSMLLATILILFFVMKRIHLPIEHLIGRIKEATGNDKSGREQRDEAAYLSGLFSDMFASAKQLKEMERDTRKNVYMRSLLLEEQAHKQLMTSRLRQLGARLDPDGSVQLISFHIDHATAFQSHYSLQDQALLRYALSNAAGEVLADRSGLELVDMGDTRIVAMMNGAGAEELEQEQVQNREAARKLGEWCSQHLKLSVTVVIGSLFQQASELHIAYQELHQLSLHRLLIGHGSMIERGIVEARQSCNMELSAVKKKRLLEALVNGKQEESEEILDEIITELGQGTYDHCVTSLYQLTYFIFHTLGTMENSKLSAQQYDIYSFTSRLGACETLEEVKRQYLELFTLICDAVGEGKNSRTKMLTESIAAYVEHHYADKNLSLESIAQEMNMSKLYVGRVFRETQGQSISDYLTEVRMKHAVRMMQDGERDVNVIMDRVGFDNRNYFYRLFKTRVGVSFAEYKIKLLNDIAEG
ncbi:helix-turn-helix domain-containing protein [Paenibacillus sp. GCM10023252]|uniref:helix-turn-helix domain-containing protein n=1 Tax=Paenibacillus sp. GCM10023252 TaxID=3252649 RepID=UPI00361EBC30